MLIKTVRQWNNVGKKPEKIEVLSHEILKKGEVSWTRVLEVADHDELVYKLTLKYLRQRGYDIGNNKIPRLKKSTYLYS
ncbi:MAG TPA: hypothetical protein VFR94_19985 [Nitrososphaeraceae archaeon]|nr:hypothetical protein [Nitrososphaeraceae archaeon]